MILSTTTVIDRYVLCFQDKGRKIFFPEGIGKQTRQIDIATFMNRQQIPAGDRFLPFGKAILNVPEKLALTILNLLKKTRLILLEVYECQCHQNKCDETRNRKISS